MSFLRSSGENKSKRAYVGTRVDGSMVKPLRHHTRFEKARIIGAEHFRLAWELRCT